MLELRFGRVEAGVPFGRHSEWRPEVAERPVTPCTLTSWFHDTGRLAMCVEFSGQYGFREDQIELAGCVLGNAFRHLGLLDGDVERPARPVMWLNDCDQVDVVSPVAGVVVLEPLAPGIEVEKGALLARVVEPDSLQAHEMVAPESGRLFRFGVMHEPERQHERPCFHPYVDPGAVIATVACCRNKT